MVVGPGNGSDGVLIIQRQKSETTRGLVESTEYCPQIFADDLRHYVDKRSRPCACGTNLLGAGVAED